MSRPVHIAALDAALDDNAVRYRNARESLWQLKHEHHEILRAIADAERAVNGARDDMKECEEAIYRLGYPILDAEGEAVGPGKRAVHESGLMNKAENKARCEKGIRL